MVPKIDNYCVLFHKTMKPYTSTVLLVKSILRRNAISDLTFIDLHSILVQKIDHFCLYSPEALIKKVKPW